MTTPRLWGRNAGGDEAHLAFLRSTQTQLRDARSLADLQTAAHSLASARLPKSLDFRGPTYSALSKIGKKWSSAQKDLVKLCDDLISQLEAPQTPRAPNVENVAPPASPSTAPPRSGSKSPLRQGLAANRASPPAAAAPGDADAPAARAPGADATPNPPAAAAAPAPKKGGRPPDQDALTVRKRTRGPPLNVALLQERVLKAALVQFLLKLPRSAQDDEVVRRGKEYFRNVPGFTFGAPSLALWKSLDDAKRRSLRDETTATLEVLSDAADAMPLIILQRLPHEAVVDYIRRIYAAKKDGKNGHKKRRRDASGKTADQRLLAGREFSFEAALKARRLVHYQNMSIRTAALNHEKETTWIGDALRRLDIADRLFWLSLVEQRLWGITISFDAGSRSAEHAGVRLKLLGVSIHFSVPRKLAPPVLLSRYGSKAAAKAKADETDRRIPQFFCEKPPKQPKVTGPALFKAQPQYTAASGTRDQLIKQKELNAKAAKAWRGARPRKKAFWRGLAKAKRVRLKRELLAYEARLAAARRICETLWRLQKRRHNRVAELSAVPSAKELYLSGVAVRPEHKTLQEQYDASAVALYMVPDAIKGACVEEVERRATERWRLLREAVPEHLRASGDASLLRGACSWTSCDQVVLSSDDADRARARAMLGLAPARAPLAPPEPRSFDPNTWREIFASTAPRPAIVAAQPPIRLVPDAAAGPGAVARPPRTHKAPRRFRDD